MKININPRAADIDDPNQIICVHEEDVEDTPCSYIEDDVIIFPYSINLLVDGISNMHIKYKDGAIIQKLVKVWED